jgi:hypothetical protein
LIVVAIIYDDFPGIDDGAADHFRIERLGHFDVAIEAALEGRADLLELCRINPRCRAQMNLEGLLGFELEFLEQRADFRQHRQPAIFRQQGDEATEFGGSRLTMRQKHGRKLGRSQARIAEQAGHPRIDRHIGGKGEFFRPAGQCALCKGAFKRGTRVGTRQGQCARHGVRSR